MATTETTLPDHAPLDVFISYARHDDLHREWVGRLADRLESEPDLHVVLDEYDNYGGKDLPHFMERSGTCDRVVVVVTSQFSEKADQRKGGVGYESGIAAATLASQQNTDRFIPVLREGSSLPLFLSGKLYIDFRAEEQFEQRVDDLLRAIRKKGGRPRPTKRDDIPAAKTELSVHELNALLREHTVDSNGESTACQACGSPDLERFHDADVDQEWADGSVNTHLNYFIDGVECRDCGWRRTEFSDGDGKVFERQITEGR